MRQRSKLHWSNVVCHPWAIVVYNVEPTLDQRRNAIWEMVIIAALASLQRISSDVNGLSVVIDNVNMNPY